MDIVYTYSPAWLLLIFFVAALASFWLYKGDKVLSEQSPWLVRLLFLFRFISISLIAFFLLEPMVRTEEREVQRPIIAIAVDNSESILNSADSLSYKNDLPLAIDKLVNEIGNSYEVELFSFAGDVSRDLHYDYSGKVSDLSNLMSELELRYYNRNLGAIIIASDGNYNQGINPVYHPVSLNAPLYSVLLGDTGSVKDLGINEVINNSISFLGDDFPVEINLSAEGIPNQNYTLKIYNNGKTVFEKKGGIDSDNWFKSISLMLPAEKIGVQRYSVEVIGENDEPVMQNNQAVFYISILDERLKIAIITSAPHPDIAVWNNALKKNKNYEVEVFEANKFNKNVNDYSLFILYQVPSNVDHIALIEKIKSAKIPYLVQVGLTTNVKLLNQALAGDYSLEEAGVEEDFKAKLNNTFSLFTIDKRIEESQLNYAPLSAPLVNLSSGQVYQKLMTKTIGQLDTDLPIWVLSESAAPKNGIIIGEGIWRWSMYSYSHFESHEVFDNFLQQNVKYLIRKGGNNRFEIDTKEAYFEGSRIKINAQLLDPSMEMAIGGDIEFSLSNSKNENFEYSFVESGNRYSLDLGILEAGNYSYESKATLGEEVFIKNGKFTIKKRMLEQKDTRANSALMYQWADKTGGELYYPNQIDQIGEKLLEKNLPSISYQTEQFSDMIRMSWLLFVIALFLSVEWFLRRYYGSY